MLCAKQIAAIHIAKSENGVSDRDYRFILRETTGASSSKDPDLGNKEFGWIMNALKTQRKGWQAGQLKKFRQYSKFCGMSLQEARRVLYVATGFMSEESPELKQPQFEQAMGALEEELEKRIRGGSVPMRNGIDLSYWRKRLPGSKISSRQVNAIETLWAQISELLPPEKRGRGYLLGILARACNINEIHDIKAIPGWRAVRAIETLKQKLEQEQQQGSAIQEEQEEVPF